MKLQHPVIKRLRFLGYAEAFSWTLLIIAMCFKYMGDQPLMVKYTGWLHGVLFILYCVHLVWARQLLHWPVQKLLLGGVAAFLPFGTLWFDKRIEETASA